MKKTFSIKWERKDNIELNWRSRVYIPVRCKIGNHLVSILYSHGQYKISITDGDTYSITSDEMPKMLEVIYTRAMYQINKRENKVYDELLKKLKARE